MALAAEEIVTSGASSSSEYRLAIDGAVSPSSSGTST